LPFTTSTISKWSVTPFLFLTLIFAFIQEPSLTADQSPIIYLIRHGEKPPKLPDGEDANGLSAQGLERAQGLRKVFGKDSIYDIQHIIAEHPKKGLTFLQPSHKAKILRNTQTVAEIAPTSPSSLSPKTSVSKSTRASTAMT
jgi:hypothetical protein